MSVILKQLVCFSFTDSLCVVTCAGKMDSDLDNLIESGGAKRSKRPRAGALKTDRSGKGPKRSKKTPPPAPPVSSSIVAATSQAGASTAVPSS